MLNKGGSNIDSWGTPNIISNKLLYEISILGLYFLLEKQLWIVPKAGKLKPHALTFAIRSSWSRQLSTLDGSVDNANTLPLSTILFHFSNLFSRHCWLLNPLQNPHIV